MECIKDRSTLSESWKLRNFSSLGSNGSLCGRKTRSAVKCPILSPIEEEEASEVEALEDNTLQDLYHESPLPTSSGFDLNQRRERSHKSCPPLLKPLTPFKDDVQQAIKRKIKQRKNVSTTTGPVLRASPVIGQPTVTSADEQIREEKYGVVWVGGQVSPRRSQNSNVLQSPDNGRYTLGESGTRRMVDIKSQSTPRSLDPEIVSFLCSSPLASFGVEEEIPDVMKNLPPISSNSNKSPAGKSTQKSKENKDKCSYDSIISFLDNLGGDDASETSTLKLGLEDYDELSTRSLDHGKSTTVLEASTKVTSNSHCYTNSEIRASESLASHTTDHFNIDKKDSDVKYIGLNEAEFRNKCNPEVDLANPDSVFERYKHNLAIFARNNVARQDLGQSSQTNQQCADLEPLYKTKHAHIAKPVSKFIIEHHAINNHEVSERSALPDRSEDCTNVSKGNLSFTKPGPFYAECKQRMKDDDDVLHKCDSVSIPEEILSEAANSSESSDGLNAVRVAPLAGERSVSLVKKSTLPPLTKVPFSRRVLLKPIYASIYKGEESQNGEEFIASRDSANNSPKSRKESGSKNCEELSTSFLSLRSSTEVLKQSTNVDSDPESYATSANCTSKSPACHIADLSNAGQKDISAVKQSILTETEYPRKDSYEVDITNPDSVFKRYKQNLEICSIKSIQDQDSVKSNTFKTCANKSKGYRSNREPVPRERPHVTHKCEELTTEGIVAEGRPEFDLDMSSSDEFLKGEDERTKKEDISKEKIGQSRNDEIRSEKAIERKSIISSNYKLKSVNGSVQVTNKKRSGVSELYTQVIMETHKCPHEILEDNIEVHGGEEPAVQNNYSIASDQNKEGGVHSVSEATGNESNEAHNYKKTCQQNATTKQYLELRNLSPIDLSAWWNEFSGGKKLELKRKSIEFWIKQTNECLKFMDFSVLSSESTILESNDPCMLANSTACQMKVGANEQINHDEYSKHDIDKDILSMNKSEHVSTDHDTASKIEATSLQTHTHVDTTEPDPFTCPSVCQTIIRKSGYQVCEDRKLNLSLSEAEGNKVYSCEKDDGLNRVHEKTSNVDDITLQSRTKNTTNSIVVVESLPGVEVNTSPPISSNISTSDRDIHQSSDSFTCQYRKRELSSVEVDGNICKEKKHSGRHGITCDIDGTDLQRPKEKASTQISATLFPPRIKGTLSSRFASSGFTVLPNKPKFPQREHTMNETQHLNKSETKLEGTVSETIPYVTNSGRVRNNGVTFVISSKFCSRFSQHRPAKVDDCGERERICPNICDEQTTMKPLADFKNSEVNSSSFEGMSKKAESDHLKVTVTRLQEGQPSEEDESQDKLFDLHKLQTKQKEKPELEEVIHNIEENLNEVSLRKDIEIKYLHEKYQLQIQRLQMELKSKDESCKRLKETVRSSVERNDTLAKAFTKIVTESEKKRKYQMSQIQHFVDQQRQLGKTNEQQSNILQSLRNDKLEVETALIKLQTQLVDSKTETTLKCAEVDYWKSKCLEVINCVSQKVAETQAICRKASVSEKGRIE